MKRRIISIVALCLAVCLMSSIAFATGETTSYNLWVDGVEVTSANSNNILSGTNYNKVSYEPTTNTLTLNGAYLTKTHTEKDVAFMGRTMDVSAVIYWNNPGTGLNIHIIGSTTIENADAGAIGIYSVDNLKVNNDSQIYVVADNGFIAQGLMNLTDDDGSNKYVDNDGYYKFKVDNSSTDTMTGLAIASLNNSIVVNSAETDKKYDSVNVYVEECNAVFSVANDLVINNTKVYADTVNEVAFMAVNKITLDTCKVDIASSPIVFYSGFPSGTPSYTITDSVLNLDPLSSLTFRGDEANIALTNVMFSTDPTFGTIDSSSGSFTVTSSSNMGLNVLSVENGSLYLNLDDEKTQEDDIPTLFEASFDKKGNAVVQAYVADNTDFGVLPSVVSGKDFDGWNNANVDTGNYGYGTVDNSNVTVSQKTVDNECYYEAPATLTDKGGTFKLYLNGEFSADTLTFTKTSKGWTIVNENGEYLALQSDLSVDFQTAAYYWNYLNGSFYVTKESKIPTYGVFSFFSWFNRSYTVNSKYYLSLDRNGNYTYSSTPVVATVTSLKNYAAHVAGEYVDNGDGTHSLHCAYCHKEMSASREEHDYNSEGICKVCGAVKDGSATYKVSVTKTCHTSYNWVWWFCVPSCSYDYTIGVTPVGCDEEYTVKAYKYDSTNTTDHYKGAELTVTNNKSIHSDTELDKIVLEITGQTTGGTSVTTYALWNKDGINYTSVI